MHPRILRRDCEGPLERTDRRRHFAARLREQRLVVDGTAEVGRNNDSESVVSLRLAFPPGALQGDAEVEQGQEIDTGKAEGSSQCGYGTSEVFGAQKAKAEIAMSRGKSRIDRHRAPEQSGGARNLAAFRQDDCRIDRRAGMRGRYGQNALVPAMRRLASRLDGERNEEKRV